MAGTEPPQEPKESWFNAYLEELKGWFSSLTMPEQAFTVVAGAAASCFYLWHQHEMLTVLAAVPGIAAVVLLPGILLRALIASLALAEGLLTAVGMHLAALTSLHLHLFYCVTRLNLRAHAVVRGWHFRRRYGGNLCLGGGASLEKVA
jgi:hypothetical protein